jgi:hypothetical protein
MPTWNIGEKLAAALPNYEKEFKDQVFNKHVLLNIIKENGGIKKKSGGTSVRVPLMIAESNSEWFSGTDQLNVAPVDTLDAAQFEWRNLNASITITLDDELSNSGPEQVIDLLEAKVQQAEMTISKALNTSAFTGTGTETRPQIVGLQTLIGTGTVGGIAGATYTDWQSYVESTSEALSVAKMRTALNTLNSRNGGEPISHIMTTQTLYEKYETLATPTYQANPIVTSKEVQRIIDAGYNALAYAGIPLSFDPSCPTGEMYFFNLKNLMMFVHKDAFMDKTPRVSPVDQHVSVQHIVIRAALGTNKRNALGKLSAKTA